MENGVPNESQIEFCSTIQMSIVEDIPYGDFGGFKKKINSHWGFFLFVFLTLVQNEFLVIWSRFLFRGSVCIY